MAAQKPLMPSPFLDSVPRVIRTLHYSICTEQSYLSWIRQYIVYHGKRHPADIPAVEIGEFLSYLASERRVAAATRNQALNALNFFYKKALNQPLGELQGVVRARRSKRLPVVLSRKEVTHLLEQLSGQYPLMAKLMYDSGLRLMELPRLGIKDVDFSRHAIGLNRPLLDQGRFGRVPVLSNSPCFSRNSAEMSSSPKPAAIRRR